MVAIEEHLRAASDQFATIAELAAKLPYSIGLIRRSARALVDIGRLRVRTRYENRRGGQRQEFSPASEASMKTRTPGGGRESTEAAPDAYADVVLGLSDARQSDGVLVPISREDARDREWSEVVGSHRMKKKTARKVPQLMSEAPAKKAAPKMRPTSEEPIVFGRVIAEREYRIGREKLLLQIGTPHQASWKTSFYCPFRFVRSGRTYTKRTFGVDAVQSLNLAFTIIKVVLETESPKITWFAAERPGDVGIDRTIPTGFGMAFDRGLSRFVDKAVLKRCRELERLHKKKAARRAKNGAA